MKAAHAPGGSGVSSAVPDVPFHSSPVSTGRLVLPWANEATARHIVPDGHDGPGTSALASLISASPATRPAEAVTVLAAAASAGARLMTSPAANAPAVSAAVPHRIAILMTVSSHRRGLPRGTLTPRASAGRGVVKHVNTTRTVRTVSIPG